MDKNLGESLYGGIGAEKNLTIILLLDIISRVGVT